MTLDTLYNIFVVIVELQYTQQLKAFKFPCPMVDETMTMSINMSASQRAYRPLFQKSQKLTIENYHLR